MWPILFFSFIQGFTEFLPISSQGHLIFFNSFFDITSQYLSIRDMNIIAHLGSLIAILFYYHKSCTKLLFSFSNFFRSDLNKDVILAQNIIISSIPIFFTGYFITSLLNEDLFTSLTLIGWTTLIFGIVLFVIDKACLRIKELENINMYTAFGIGIIQSLAVIPGFSRSGLVISIMRVFGYRRIDSVNYSNLLSIPAIFGAVGYLILTHYETTSFNIFFNIEAFFILALSFIFSLFFIHFLVSWVKKSSFAIFMIYRIILGTAMLFLSYKSLFNVSW